MSASRKWTALALTLALLTAMAGAAMAGAAMAAGTVQDVIPKDVVTLQVYSQLANYAGEQVGWFGKTMLDKFNVKLNIINEADGTFATRMAAQDLGDIILFGNDGDEYLQAVGAGLLFDWEDEDLLTDYGPYIAEHMEKALAKNRALSGGVLYGFGHNVGTSVTDHESYFYYPDLRWDLYKAIGYPQIATLEDYVPVLKAMQEIEPTSETGGKTYGMSIFPDWDGDMVMFVKATGALYGYDEFGVGLYDVNSQTFEAALEPGGMYLRCLAFYNKLYREGLLNPDSMTQTFNDVSEDYQTGAAFFNLFSWMGSGLYNSQDHLAAGKMMYAKTADDAVNLTYGLNVNGGNRIWAIGAKTFYPELCMAIIDWLSTPEGVMTYNYGPKDVTWEYIDGKPYLTELGLKTSADNTTPMPEPYTGTFDDGSFKMNNTTWSVDASNPETPGETYNKTFWTSTLEAEPSDIMKDWQEKTGAKIADDYLEDGGHISIAIGTSFSFAPRSDELNTTWAQVITAVKDGSWKAIYAADDAAFETIVAEMTAQAKAYGYDQCVEFTQAQAEIRKAAENAAKAE
ncbi:MAG: hypothetical protein LBB86_04025 [Oscillospiraceae bacterium]|jgi:multiple sugar transport system substrate-binding protein/putative aldouronate transport system substrate-binding protein|nr:hypothetical protein [Oscillospiraceae bacterium]